MKIFNIPPIQDGYPQPFDEEESVVMVSRHADTVVESIEKIASYLSKNQQGTIHQSKFHDLVTQLVQKFADFHSSFSSLVRERPKYTDSYLEALDVYNESIQPFVVMNFNHIPSQNHISESIHMLEEAKERLTGVIEKL